MISPTMSYLAAGTYCQKTINLPVTMLLCHILLTNVIKESKLFFRTLEAFPLHPVS